MTVLDALGIGFTAFVTIILANSLRKGELWADYAVLRTIRGEVLKAILSAALVVVAVLGLGIALFLYGGPVLQFSWLKLLAATPQEAAGAGQNLLVAGLRIPFFVWVFLALLMLNVPRLALNEEYLFREGVHGRVKVGLYSVMFGLAHCLVGVPVSIGLALTIAGLWFAYQYRLGGVERAAAYHAIHNWIILTLFAVAILVPW